MQWFRTSASRVALAARLSLAAATFSAAAPHGGAHDAACDLVTAEHDASAHRMTAAATTDEHSLHCLACHWARSFRLRTEIRVVLIAASAAGIADPVEYVPTVVSAPVAQPPLRSPPAPFAFV